RATSSPTKQPGVSFHELVPLDPPPLVADAGVRSTRSPDEVDPSAISPPPPPRATRVGGLIVALVPPGLLLGLALASGGFFPDSVAVAAVVVLVLVAVLST